MFHHYYGIPNNAKYGEEFMARFPILFQERSKPMNETCMCWGIDCPIGWYHIIEQLCTVLEFYNIDIGKKYHLAIIAEQVKEKFGTLRFYFNIHHVNDEGVIDYETEYPDVRIQSDYLDMLACSAIDEAEELTEKTCADCGIPLDDKNTVETKGWITYICKDCDEERKKKTQEWIEKNRKTEEAQKQSDSSESQIKQDKKDE